MNRGRIAQWVPASIRRKLRKALVGDYYTFHKAYSSFSDCGEDRILNYLFAGKSEGFYVDVGAHRPITISNTHYFYCQGWHGINVEAFPDKIEEFKKLRPLDTNLGVGISDSDGYMTLYTIGDGASSMNSFDRDNMLKLGINEAAISSLEVPVRTLRSVLQEHAPDSTIDFLNIDVEGHEMAVLESNDWERFRPRVIVLENFKALNTLSNHEPVAFLDGRGYKLSFVTPNQIILLERGCQLSVVNQLV